MKALVEESTDASFAQDVVERSRELPVVVDFWAPWCGPCRLLGPVLEQMATEFEGRVALVKVNTDENPRTAQQFQIQSIPAVYAFKDGQPVGQFLGAQPAPQVRQFFESIAPSAADRDAQDAARLFQAGQPGAARERYEAILATHPDHRDAAFGLAALLLDTGDLEQAQALVSKWPDEPLAKQIAATLALQGESAGLDHAALEQRLAADPDDAEAHYGLGRLQAAVGEWETALEHLLMTVRLGRSLDDDGGRRRMLDIFAILGAEHPLTQSYQRRLAGVIF